MQKVSPIQVFTNYYQLWNYLYCAVDILPSENIYLFKCCLHKGRSSKRKVQTDLTKLLLFTCKNMSFHIRITFIVLHEMIKNIRLNVQFSQKPPVFSCQGIFERSLLWFLGTSSLNFASCDRQLVAQSQGRRQSVCAFVWLAACPSRCMWMMCPCVSECVWLSRSLLWCSERPACFSGLI